MHCKIHGMATRHEKQDTENVPDVQDSTALHLMPQDHPMPEEDNDSPNEYKETDTHCPLADLLEQFQQIKKQFASLTLALPSPHPQKKLLQLPDKLQHLIMMLQPAPSPLKSQYTRQCSHTQTPYTQHKGNQISLLPCSKISPHLMGKTLQS